MKINIPLKILLAFILLFTVFSVIFFYFLKSIEGDIGSNAGRIITQGVLTNLSNKLVNVPKADWHTILLNQADNAVGIIAISKLKLSATEKSLLKSGKIIFVSGKTYQFLNLVIVEATAYKEIGNTSYALAYNFSNPARRIKYYIIPTLQTIINALKTKPKHLWHQEILRLQKMFGFPINVYSLHSKQLPNNLIGSIKNNLAFSMNAGTSQISTLYYAFKNSVLQIGPLHYLKITERITDIIYYFVLAFFILCLCIVIVFSLLFLRNVKKLYRTTKHFSEGDFSVRPKIAHSSVLYDLHCNINAMGDKLQQLIESKKKLSRFVAHEIRTPLYTMQLALDSLSEISNLPKDSKEYVTSLKEDILQINDLVSLFLLYSQSANKELKIVVKPVNIRNWLETTIKRHRLSTIDIQLKFSSLQKDTVYFDPKLLKHAIDNIIINAIKFAKKQIMVSLMDNKASLIISIDDDGTGIVDKDREKAFDAFTTLGNSKSFGGHIGLGLFIAKSIVELHFGEIHIETSSLGGCRFSINLPKLLSTGLRKN